MPQSARVEGEEKRIQKKKVQAKEEKETEAAEDNKKLKSPTTFLSDGSGIRKNLNLKFWDCAMEYLIMGLGLVVLIHSTCHKPIFWLIFPPEKYYTRRSDSGYIYPIHH